MQKSRSQDSGGGGCLKCRKDEDYSEVCLVFVCVDPPHYLCVLADAAL